MRDRKVSEWLFRLSSRPFRFKSYCRRSKPMVRKSIVAMIHLCQMTHWQKPYYEANEPN